MCVACPRCIACTSLHTSRLGVLACDLASRQRWQGKPHPPLGELPRPRPMQALSIDRFRGGPLHVLGEH